MTLKEIASLAGVSPSTVSRVINHPGSKAASREVENKIWEIIRETGYIPDNSRPHPYLRPFFFQNYPGAGTGSFAQRLYRKIYLLLSGHPETGYPGGYPSDQSGRRGPFGPS